MNLERIKSLFGIRNSSDLLVLLFAVQAPLSFLFTNTCLIATLIMISIVNPYRDPHNILKILSSSTPFILYYAHSLYALILISYPILCFISKRSTSRFLYFLLWIYFFIFIVFYCSANLIADRTAISLLSRFSYMFCSIASSLFFSDMPGMEGGFFFFVPLLGCLLGILAYLILVFLLFILSLCKPRILPVDSESVI